MSTGRLGAGDTAIQPTIFDAKGDLLTATAADTPARIAVGSNGLSLVADSAQSSGLKWGYPNFIGCNLQKTASQTISNNTYTSVSFDVEVFDTDGFHDNVTNNSRITIPSGKGGYYLLFGQSIFVGNTTGYRSLKFQKNGTTFLGWQGTTGTASYSEVNTTYIASLAAGDYVEMQVAQNSGGNLNIYGNPEDAGTTSFMITYLGA